MKGKFINSLCEKRSFLYALKYVISIYKSRYVITNAYMLCFMTDERSKEKTHLSRLFICRFEAKFILFEAGLIVNHMMNISKGAIFLTN